MATTTNFGWTTPDDTDFVKDGAADIRTAFNAVDSSFADLKGGTTGQALVKASNTDLDFTFAVPDTWALIQSQNLTTGTTVTFSSIPGTYEELVLVVRNVQVASSGTTLSLRVNGLTTNYAYVRSYANGTTATHEAVNAGSGFAIDVTTPNTATNSVAIITIGKYAASYLHPITISYTANVTGVAALQATGVNKGLATAVTSVSLITTSTAYVGGVAELYGRN